MSSNAATSSMFRKVDPPTPTLQTDDLLNKFISSVQECLGRHAGRKKGNRLLSIALEYPDTVDPRMVYEMAHRLCETVVVARGDSLWLALGFDDQGRPGWHGVAATEESAGWISLIWSVLTSGRAKIKVIAGKNTHWSFGDGHLLHRKLKKVIKHALKPQALADIPEHCRVVARGFLKVAWIEGTGLGIGDRKSSLASRAHRTGKATCQEMMSSNSAGHSSSTPVALSPERRRCRNHEACRGFIPPTSPTGRPTSANRLVCDVCAAIRDEGYAAFRGRSGSRVREDGSRYPF
jgi:hypothetical protein